MYKTFYINKYAPTLLQNPCKNSRNQVRKGLTVLSQDTSEKMNSSIILNGQKNSNTMKWHIMDLSKDL